jgi:hypothetical protein
LYLNTTSRMRCVLSFKRKVISEDLLENTLKPAHWDALPLTYITLTIILYTLEFHQRKRLVISSIIFGQLCVASDRAARTDADAWQCSRSHCSCTDVCIHLFTPPFLLTSDKSNSKKEEIFKSWHSLSSSQNSTRSIRSLVSLYCPKDIVKDVVDQEVKSDMNSGWWFWISTSTVYIYWFSRGFLQIIKLSAWKILKLGHRFSNPLFTNTQTFHAV